MKRFSRVCTAVAAVLALSLTTAATAFAGFDDFPDGKGHWAEPYLRSAVDDGLINGMGDGTLSPNAPASMSQVLTILCRLLEPGTGELTAGDLGIDGDKWYTPYALGARELGLDFDASRLENGGLTRAETFLLIADAFRLIPAEPDYSALEVFSDSGLLLGRQRDAAAAMVSAGYLTGHDGLLDPLGGVTRAEFMTMLYRVAGVSVTEGTLPQGTPGGAVLRGQGDIAGASAEGPVWLARTAGSADLTEVKAPAVTVMSEAADAVTGPGTDIGRLTLAGGASGEVTVGGGRIGTLVLAEGAPGVVNVSGGVDRIEVTGRDIEVNVLGDVGEIAVSGSGCRVNLRGGAESLRLTAESRGNKINAAGEVGSLTLRGEDNTVTADGQVRGAELYGRGCRLTGRGRADKLSVYTYNSTWDLRAGTTWRQMPKGVEDLALELTLPESVRAGEAITATAKLSNPFNLNCSVTWYVNGAPVQVEPVQVGRSPVQVTLEHTPAVSDGPAAGFTVSAVVTAQADTGKDDGAARVTEFGYVGFTGLEDLLKGAVVEVESASPAEQCTLHMSARVTNPIRVNASATWYVDGAAVRTQKVTAGPDPVVLTLDRKVTTLPATGVSRVELRLSISAAGNVSSASGGCDVELGITPEEVLKLVTSKYAGDYTTQWALDHDYSEAVKTAFVNAKGYTSRTPYLIWVNLTYQRVNIFENDNGSWRLIKTFLGATGGKGHSTPVGVYYIFGRSERGWDFGSYICKPVVNFYVGTGYAFHTRLWNRSHTELVDGSIGYPISHGCVRMYDEDVQWIYDNMPTYTTVVVH